MAIGSAEHSRLALQRELSHRSEPRQGNKCERASAVGAAAQVSFWYLKLSPEILSLVQRKAGLTLAVPLTWQNTRFLAAGIVCHDLLPRVSWFRGEIPFPSRPADGEPAGRVPRALVSGWCWGRAV